MGLNRSKFIAEYDTIVKSANKPQQTGQNGLVLRGAADFASVADPKVTLLVREGGNGFWKILGVLNHIPGHDKFWGTLKIKGPGPRAWGARNPALRTHRSQQIV